MKLNNIQTLFRNAALAVVLIFSSISCDDILDVQPRNTVAAGTILTTPQAIQAAINSVYARLRAQSNYGRDLVAVSDALADIGFATNNSGRLIQEARNQIYFHFTHWQNSYFAINEINITLEAIANNALTPAATQAQLDKWNAELKFLRALYYHDLVKAYAYDPGATVASQDRGGVPLMLEAITTSAAATGAQKPRATVAEVYAQIYKDLNEALATAPTTGGPFFATRAAIQGLFSRVALFNRDYNTVVTQSTNAITSGGALISGAAYINGWRASTNPESLFEVKFQDANESLGVNVSMQSSFTSGLSLSALTAQGGWGDFAPATSFRTELGITGPTLVTANTGTFCTGTDIRTQLYFVSPGRGTIRVESAKYISKNGIAYLDNVPVIRKTEMYLNRAEAYATPGSPAFNEANALADLNTVRVARGLTAVALTGAALYNEIIQQRKLEFAFEGQRWFDLKRLGRDVIKVGLYAGAVDVAFTDTRILANIPQREVDGNPSLVQNPGY